MITRLVVSLALLFCGIPFVAEAVTFVDGPPSNPKAGVGQLVARTLYLDTEGENINAVEGVVSYDTKTLRFESVVDGGSIIAVWLKKLVVNEDGTLSFSGIIPGGYTGGEGKLFTLYFRARDVGNGPVVLTGSGYKNDGKGTRVAISPRTLAVAVVEGSVAGLATDIVSSDAEAPNSIKAVVAQNEAMFGGRPFIIMDAKDSQSGIERYELLQSETKLSLEALEGASLAWKTVSNPAALASPIGKYLYVRAIDRAGNAAVVEVSREEQLSPEPGDKRFSQLIAFGILAGGLVILYLLYRLMKPSHA